MAEIAYISLHETKIQLTAILDDRRVGKKFFNHTVQAGDALRSTIFDRILLTTSEFGDLMPDGLKKMGISEDRVVILQ